MCRLRCIFIIFQQLPPNGLRPEAVPEFFRKSLTDLQLSYVDLYLMHYPAAVKVG